MNIFVGLIIVVYIYFVSFKSYNCPDVQLRSPHPKTLEIASSNPLGERSVLKLSAPEILQRPAPQPGAPLFGAPRPERPSAPANPADKPQRGPAPVLPPPGAPEIVLDGSCARTAAAKSACRKRATRQRDQRPRRRKRGRQQTRIIRRLVARAFIQMNQSAGLERPRMPTTRYWYASRLRQCASS